MRKTLLLLLLLLLPLGACRREEPPAPPAEDRSLLPAVLAHLDSRRNWPVHEVKIHLAMPEVVILYRDPDGMPRVVHLWSWLHNDFSVPMLRADGGEFLYELSPQEFADLAKLGEDVHGYRSQSAHD